MAQILNDKGGYVVMNPDLVQNPDIAFLQTQSNVLTKGNYQRTTRGIIDLTTGNVVAELTPQNQTINLSSNVPRSQIESATTLSQLQALDTAAQPTLNQVRQQATQQNVLTPQQLLAQGDIVGMAASRFSGLPYTPIGGAGSIPPISPINIPGKSTEAPPNIGKTVTLPNGQQVQVDEKGNILSNLPTAYPSPTGNPITSANSLANNVAMDSYLKKLDDAISNLAAGFSVGGETKILGELFEKYGIQKQLDSLDAYNQIVIQSKKQLKELPEAIQHSLENVGVTQDQLTRLQNKETKPILDALNETMAQAGLAQDRVNQSLKLVGMFADAAHADQAARLEISKFQIQQGLSIYKDMKQDQKDLLDRALTDQTNRMTLAGTVSSNGAPQEVVDSIINAPDYATASVLASKYLSSKAMENYAIGLAAEIQGLSHTLAADKVAALAKAKGYDPILLYGLVQQAQQKQAQGLSDFEAAFLRTNGRLPNVSELQNYNRGTQKPTESERASAAIAQFQNAFVYGAKLKDGTEIIGTDGFINPRAWKEAIADAPTEGLSREQFIKEFGHFLNPKHFDNYGLSPIEEKLITGVIS